MLYYFLQRKDEATAPINWAVDGGWKWSAEAPVACAVTFKNESAILSAI